MKKIVAILGIAMLCTQSQVQCSSVGEITEQRGYISANAEKTKDVYPNFAEVTFTKESTEKTLEAASNENKIVIAQINKSLQAYKTDTTKMEIRTGSYTARPNYSYKGDKKNLTGYTVENSITVKTQNTELLGKLIDAAIKAGADRVGALSFSFENDGSVCKDLIYLATQEAHTMAKVAADSAKQQLKGVKSINTGCYTQMNNTTNFRNYNAKAMSADTGVIEETSITPGKIKVRATVNAEFYVK